ncbi:MAG: hypothetical protein G01um101413_803 [Parcubacteria group bacterium Gr01-1014_13]|nr:MAG: hypothetical protein G01um101413_803 [Parcubacteria group bacterium Gr01-1014_13]
MPKLIGTIEHKKVNADSLSKTREWYIVVLDNGENQQVRLKGEHVIEQPTLKALVGKRCELRGKQYGDLFIADTVKEVEKK